MTCKECKDEFRQSRKDQIFCCSQCRQKWWRRVELRGGQAVEKLIAWRVSRGSKKGALGEIAAMVDGWIKEDRT
jgi:hypothetical protein